MVAAWPLPRESLDLLPGTVVRDSLRGITAGSIVFGVVILVRLLNAPKTAIGFAAVTILLSGVAIWWTGEYALVDRLAWNTSAPSGVDLPLPGPYSAVSALDGATWQSSGRQIGLVYAPHDSRLHQPDECVHHIVGAWWGFVSSTGNCPSDYQFIGGP